MALVINHNKFSYAGGENLESYRPWPLSNVDPNIGEIRPEFQSQENIWSQNGREDVRENSFIGYEEISNFHPAVDPNELPAAEVEYKAKTFLDKLFGVLGVAGHIYEDIKSPDRPEQPILPDVAAGLAEERRISRIAWVAGGCLVVGMILLFSASKK